MNARKLTLLGGAIAIAIAVVLSTAFLWRETDRNSAERGTGSALIGGEFELVDHESHVVTDADFRGKFMLIYFGYTFCPDVCPTELQAMSAAIDELGAAGTEVQPIFITVDPARDTVAVMADYRGHFHPRLIALTGTPEQISAAAKAYRVYYAKNGDESAEDYLMDHSSFVYLMDRDGRYVTHFAPNTLPEAMAARVRESL